MADQAENDAGIFADVLPELRKTLAGCAAFASHEALSAIFVDPRCPPHTLPAALNHLSLTSSSG